MRARPAQRPAARGFRPRARASLGPRAHAPLHHGAPAFLQHGARTPLRYGARAFTLVELLVFIVILGIAAVGLLTALRYVMPRQLQASTLTQAAEVAQMRMELILGQREAQTYQAMTDPCVTGTPLSALCSNPQGFQVSVTGVSSAVAWTSLTTAAYKVITVTVKDGTGTRTLATLSSLLANY